MHETSVDWPEVNQVMLSLHFRIAPALLFEKATLQA